MPYITGNAKDQETAAEENTGASYQALSRGPNPKLRFARIEAVDGILNLLCQMETGLSVSRTGTLAGHGENVATFLEPGMAVKGQEVK